jgi:hypothetical protein
MGNPAFSAGFPDICSLGATPAFFKHGLGKEIPFIPACTRFLQYDEFHRVLLLQPCVANASIRIA